MKKTIALLSFILIIITNTACTPVSVDAGEEGVLIYQPWFFGHGGVDYVPITTGLTWTVYSTSVQKYNIKPVKKTEVFVDLTAADNVAIDFNVYLTLQIKAGSSPVLHEKNGILWYSHNVKDYFRTIVRNEGRIRTSIELRTKPEIIEQVQRNIKEKIVAYVMSINMPINIVKVVVGKVIPPQEVLNEAERTAAQKQRVQTEKARATAELARKEAEKNKALADKAYTNEFKMTTDQFLRNKELNIMEKAVTGGNVSLIMNASNAQPIFKVRNK